MRFVEQAGHGGAQMQTETTAVLSKEGVFSVRTLQALPSGEPFRAVVLSLANRPEKEGRGRTRAQGDTPQGRKWTKHTHTEG